jgi:hypothetical protein
MMFDDLPTIVECDRIELALELCWKQDEQKWLGIHWGCGCLYRSRLKKNGKFLRSEYPSLCDEHKRRFYRMENTIYYQEFLDSDPRFEPK